MPQESVHAKIRAINKRLKGDGAKWRAGYASTFYPSPEESKKLFPPISPIPDDGKAGLPIIRAVGTETFPLVWDWREMNGVTPVKHQFRPYDCDACYEYCGSCYAFAACAQLESFIKIYDGREENLSEQQILSCRRELNPPTGPGGCFGGDATLAYNTFLDPGAVAETCMVYAASHEIPCGERGCSIHGRISGYSIVANDASSLKLALMSGPVWIDMYSCDDFKYLYTGGSYTYPPGVARAPNHAMLCVGWNDTLTVCDSTGCERIGSWIVKNSWGTAWGYGGYGYIQYGTPSFAEDACQIHYTPGGVTRLYLREPNGAQVWAAGSSHKILWHAAGIEAASLELGYIRGGQHILIDGQIDPSAGEYIWTPGEEAIGECVVTVAARGPAGELLGSDSSDAPLSVIAARVGWAPDGVAVCGGDFAQRDPEIVSDHLGGAIVVWRDERNGNPDIYAQRLDGAGNALWPACGVCVSASTAYRSGVRAVSDGSGGVFVVWQQTPIGPSNEPMSKYVHAQHVDPSGNLLSRSVVIGELPGSQQRPQIVSDGAGGAYIVWEDLRVGEADIYIQRINQWGGSVWETDIPLCTAADAQSRPQLVGDGSGGAVVAWNDKRSDGEYIYAQRISPAGNIAWPQNGVPVCPSPGMLSSFALVDDRRGGAIAAWLDRRSGTLGIRAQRILSDGRAAWDPSGVAICSAALEPGNLAIAPDGFGGVIAAWDDMRGEWIGQVYPPVRHIENVEYQRDIYAQRVAAGGDVAWAPGGVPIAALPKNQETPRITFDGAGGAVVSWSDKRDSRWLHVGDLDIPEDENNYDIFAQRIDTAGTVLWRENGEPLCAEPGAQLEAALTAEHGTAVFVAWEEPRDGGPRVLLQKIAGSYSARRCAISAALLRNGASYGVAGAVLSSCPRGDHRDTLSIALDFLDSDMADISSISPADIELIAEGQGISFHDHSAAGTPGTPENGYVVTIRRHRAAGCGACPGGACPRGSDPPQRLTVRYAGAAIGSIDGLRIRSVDARGDGVVSALTNDGIAPAFGRHSTDFEYRRCYDFDDSGAIDHSDLSAVAAHYGHGAAASAPAPAPRSALGGVGLRLISRRLEEDGAGGKLAVTVVLENAQGLSSLILALDGGSPRLLYRRWIPAADLQMRFPCATAVRDGRPLFCVAGYGLRSIEDPSFEIGTFEFDVTSNDSIGGDITPSLDLAVVFCDFVDERGAVGSVVEAAYENAPPVIGNHLAACYPNPFNPRTTIRYSIMESGPVSLRVYTVTGALVKTLVDAPRTPRVSGYSVEWDGRNNAGIPVASGVYLYRLTARKYSETRKMVLLK